MGEASRILENDRDEWFFYHSLERYNNLYMFELEFPIDAIEVINETSLCFSGLQNYSKKCEILQLSIPPKLLPKETEEGLCKDRDFKIISGGYAPSRILQIKSIPVAQDLVAATQVGVKGVNLYELGNEEHALIKTREIFEISPDESAAGVIECKNNSLISTGTSGSSLYSWTFDSTGSNTDKNPQIYKLPQNNSYITKVSFWDQLSPSLLTLLSEGGEISLFDTRAPTKYVFTHSAFKPNAQQTSCLYSFDSLSSKNKIGIIDSCGGFESIDVRKIGENLSSNLSIFTKDSESDVKNKILGNKSESALPLVENSDAPPQKVQKIDPPPPLFVEKVDAPPSLVEKSDAPPSLVEKSDAPPSLAENCNKGSGLADEKLSKRGGRCLLPRKTELKGVLSGKFNMAYDKNLRSGNEEGDNFIVSGTMDDYVQIYREANGEVGVIFEHDGHAKIVSHALWHPTSENLVLSSSVDAVLQAWQYQVKNI